MQYITCYLKNVVDYSYKCALIFQGLCVSAQGILTEVNISPAKCLELIWHIFGPSLMVPVFVLASLDNQTPFKSRQHGSA